MQKKISLSINELAPQTWENYKKIDTVPAFYIRVKSQKVTSVLEALKQNGFEFSDSYRHVKRVNRTNDNCKDDANILVSVGEAEPNLSFLVETLGEMPEIVSTVTHQLQSRSIAECRALNARHWPYAFRKYTKQWTPLAKTPNEEGLAETAFYNFKTLNLNFCKKPNPCSLECHIYHKNRFIASACGDYKNPLNHAVMLAIDAIGNFIANKKTTSLACNNIFSTHSNIEIEIDENAISTRQYYLTEFSVFLNSEPCCMCSMALVHSRVKDVNIWRNFNLTVDKECFYDIKKEKNIITANNIDKSYDSDFYREPIVAFVKNLNHHYRVYLIK